MSPIIRFINEEMRRRDMSARQFAMLMGMSHTTLLKVVDEDDPKKPSLEFLIKLADVTHTDIRDLVAMVAPEVAGEEANMAALMTRYRRLSKEQQEVVNRLIAGYILESPDENAEG